MQNIKYVIEDESHAELHGEYSSYEDAVAELQKIRNIPYGQAPNICPCTSSTTCRRNYEIVKFDTTVAPWKELERTRVLEVSAKQTLWLLK